jgi:hypothetical protein
VHDERSGRHEEEPAAVREDVAVARDAHPETVAARRATAA